MAPRIVHCLEPVEVDDGDRRWTVPGAAEVRADELAEGLTIEQPGRGIELRPGGKLLDMVLGKAHLLERRHQVAPRIVEHFAERGRFAFL